MILHGDASVYGVIVGLGQWWKTRPLLIKPQGNFGSIFGDGAAAMRYTEVEMSQFMWDCCFAEWKDQMVNFKPNYSGTILEPEYLVTKYPLVLFTGTCGLGYGLYSGIPPFNLNEVHDELIALIKNPNKRKVTLIPDFPTPCDLVKTDFDKICEKGEGSFRIRGKIEVDDKGNLHIKSIPYQTTLNTIVDEQIPDLVEKAKLNMFVDMIDKSSKGKHDQDKTDIDVEIILRKGADPQQAMDLLYKSTDLETTFAVNMEMVYEYENIHYNLKAYMLDWIETRRDAKRRLYLYQYSIKNKRYMMLNCIIGIISKEGSDKKLLSIMRNSKNRAEIVSRLIKEFKITDLEADVIADFKYSQLSKESLKRYKEEKEQLTKEMKEISKIIHNDELIDEEIIQELKDGKKKYGSPRTSDVVEVKDPNYVEDEEYNIIITKRGYLKKLDTSFDEVGNLEQGDKVTEQLVINNRDALMIFDCNGKCYNLPVNDILVTPLDGIGYHISNYINTNNKIVKIMRKPTEKELDSSLVFVTKYGFVKKSEVSNYINVTKGGLIGLTLKEISKDAKDQLVDVILLGKRNKDILIYTENGNASRFSTKEIPNTLRMSSGVIGIKMNEDDKVIGMMEIDKTKEFLAMITSKGNGKKIPIENCNKQTRASNGYRLIALDDNEKIAGMKAVDKKDTIDVYFNNRIETLDTKDINTTTKIAKGKKVVGCKKGEHIIMIG